MSAVRIARLTEAPLDVVAHLDAVTSPAAGAVATFVGQVRDHDPGVPGDVVRLDYSAHPDAGRVLTRLAEEVAADADVVALAVSHRTGTLEVGAVAVVVAVATAHRDAAFRLCRELVERVKAELPVWKRQVSADGVSSWVGM